MVQLLGPFGFEPASLPMIAIEAGVFNGSAPLLFLRSTVPAAAT
jgi:hypothetical protein